VLDIQSAAELIFVNGMVHLPQEWNFGTPTTLPSQLHHLHPSQWLTKHLRDVTLRYMCV